MTLQPNPTIGSPVALRSKHAKLWGITNPLAHRPLSPPRCVVVPHPSHTLLQNPGSKHLFRIFSSMPLLHIPAPLTFQLGRCACNCR
jgi:hypothetical protein